MSILIKEIYITKENYEPLQLFEKAKQMIEDASLDVSSTFLENLDKVSFENVQVTKMYHVIYQIVYKGKIDYKQKDGSEHRYEIERDFVEISKDDYQFQIKIDDFNKEDLEKITKNDLETKASIFDEKSLMRLIDKNFKSQKEYQSAHLESELWSTIEEAEVTIYVIPYISFKIVDHTQYADLTSGEVKISYQLSKEITSYVNNIRIMRYPVIALNIAFAIIYFILNLNVQNRGIEVNGFFLAMIIMTLIVFIVTIIITGGKKLRRDAIIKDIQEGKDPLNLHRKVLYLFLITAAIQLVEIGLFYLFYMN